ncbi:MAG: GntR family transcriptional regulator [Salinibacterium sp.]|nr:GntR family transcriptional regulator [Salinibacterium sp.]
MTFYSRRGIHGQVVDVLGLRILSGELLPGSVVDPEALSAEFGVSRTVVREAIKVLAAKGLMDARPRTGTRITERSRWRLLDTDVMNWRARNAGPPPVA